MLWLVLAMVAGAEPEVLLPAPGEIVFETSAQGEVDGAVEDLKARRFEDAGRRFRVLAESGRDPGLWAWSATAYIEGGELHQAKEVLTAGVAAFPSHPRLLMLEGLVLAEKGDGPGARRALDAAVAGADDDVKALALLNRGLLGLDLGDVASARADLSAAADLARRRGNANVLARATSDLALADALEGKGKPTDPVGVVGDALSRGDMAAAKAAIPKGGSGDRRNEIQASLAAGAVARAEGRHEAAGNAFRRAVAIAEEGGMVREGGAACAQLGTLYASTGRFDLASEWLGEAITKVDGTSFQVALLSYRIQAGRIAVRNHDLAAAKAHLAAARRITAQDAQSRAGLDEIEGLIGAEGKDPAAADRSLVAAQAAYSALGFWVDAARVAALRVELWSGREEAKAKALQAEALGLFAKSRDPLGPAHVGVAVGLGKARERDGNGALKAFVDAAGVAEGVGGDQAKALAKVARENAAAVLVSVSGGSAEAQAQAKEWGLSEVVDKAAAFTRASESYDKALKDYNEGRFTEASRGFDAALKDFERIKESPHAHRSRLGRAWADYNAWNTGVASSAYPVYMRLIEEGLFLQEPELRVRSMGAAAVLAKEIGRPEAKISLRAAAAEAEKLGLDNVAGQCHAAVVSLEPQLADKVRSAERAFELRGGDEVGRYALYEAAMAAYNGDALADALRLAEKAAPGGGKVEVAARELISAAREAQ